MTLTETPAEAAIRTQLEACADIDVVLLSLTAAFRVAKDRLDLMVSEGRTEKRVHEAALLFGSLFGSLGLGLVRYGRVEAVAPDLEPTRGPDISGDDTPVS